MTPPPASADHPPWLAPPRAAPDQRLHPGNREFATLLLNWLRELPETAMLEWVVETEPGGGMQSWLRCHDAAPGDLSLLAAATGGELEVALPPPDRAWASPPLYVHLGSPIAWCGDTIFSFDMPVDRARWLAARGVGLRLVLRLWPLVPLEASRRRVARAQAAALEGERSGLHPGPQYEPSGRLLGGVVFELSITSDRPLGIAERALLARSFQSNFTPLARLTAQRAPALAETKLAEALLREFSATRPMTPEEGEAADQVTEATEAFTAALLRGEHP